MNRRDFLRILGVTAAITTKPSPGYIAAEVSIGNLDPHAIVGIFVVDANDEPLETLFLERLRGATEVVVQTRPGNNVAVRVRRYGLNPFEITVTAPYRLTYVSTPNIHAS